MRNRENKYRVWDDDKKRHVMTYELDLSGVWWNWQMLKLSVMELVSLVTKNDKYCMSAVQSTCRLIRLKWIRSWVWDVSAADHKAIHKAICTKKPLIVLKGH